MDMIALVVECNLGISGIRVCWLVYWVQMGHWFIHTVHFRNHAHWRRMHSLLCFKCFRFYFPMFKQHYLFLTERDCPVSANLGMSSSVPVAAWSFGCPWEVNFSKPRRTAFKVKVIDFNVAAPSLWNLQGDEHSTSFKRVHVTYTAQLFVYLKFCECDPDCAPVSE